MISILIDTAVVARTPRHLGVNVEVQDHHDRTNLWDWIADSGATALREFHPEKTLRARQASAGDWAGVGTPADFQAYRRRVAADPAGQVPWGDYAFDRPVRWLGVPDGIVRKVRQLDIEPIISMGYAPRHFPRPLVSDLCFRGAPADGQIDWPAAASAYEYYFAMMWRYAAMGCRYFLLHNEPEYHGGLFHLPPDLAAKGAGLWDAVTQQPGLWEAFAESIATQMGVLARLARCALEDVRSALTDRTLSGQLLLLSPAGNVLWETFWKYAREHVDVCDYHHYHPDPSAFRRTYDRVAARVKPPKRTAVTEFNRIGGPIRIPDILFGMTPALEAAGLLMTSLELARPGEAACELATFYVLHFPSTHRNYKHLLYGDMNVIDWTGVDTPLTDRGPEWYPTFDELQVRFATPAYHMFRMLCRCVPGGRDEPAGYDVLRTGNGIFFPSPAAALRLLVVRRKDDLVVTILNPTAEIAKDVELDLEFFAGQFRSAIVRESSVRRGDEVVGELAVKGAPVKLDVAAQSLTQVILTPLDLAAAGPLEIEERTTTPGGVKGLTLWQTTRLRAFARIDGARHDLTCLNVIWKSSAPQIVRVGAGGLVQRLRNSSTPVTVWAETMSGAKSAPVTIG